MNSIGETTSDEITLTGSAGWFHYPASVAKDAGTYYITVNANGSGFTNNQTKYNNGASYDTMQKTLTYSSFPATQTGTAQQARLTSIYATYEEAGGGEPAPRVYESVWDDI